MQSNPWVKGLNMNAIKPDWPDRTVHNQSTDSTGGSIVSESRLRKWPCTGTKDTTDKFETINLFFDLFKLLF